MLKQSSHFPFLLLLLLTTACEAERPIEDYYEARRLLWSEVYPDGGRTLYCDQKFGSRHPKSINVEHVFPMGWVMRELKCGDRKTCRRNSTRFNLIEADLHNLYPAREKVNRDRSSYAFGEIKGEKRGIELFKRQRNLMLKWHQADPPDDEEKRRNNVIEMLQGNRNHFIDE